MTELSPGDPIFSVHHLRHRDAAREIVKDVTLTIHYILAFEGEGRVTYHLGGNASYLAWKEAGSPATVAG